MTDHEAAEWADSFWTRAGRRERFPRSLETPIARALPVAIVKLPRLATFEVRQWLSRNGIRAQLLGPDRQLRGCLLAKSGRGLIILDGSDPEDERRITVAHELAHFLLDYYFPRRRVLDVLGDAGLEILNGARLPTEKERLTGALRGLAIGIYIDLMDRTAEGSVTRLEVLEAEDRADRLALELLAPKAALLRRFRLAKMQLNPHIAVDTVTEILVGEFGLPRPSARDYATFLAMGERSKRTFAEWLGV